MWWVAFVACGPERIPPLDRARDTGPAGSSPTGTTAPARRLTVGPPDAVWGRDALWCDADDGAAVAWEVDGAPVATVGGQVPAATVRLSHTWTCTAPGAASVSVTPRVAGGNVLLLVVDDIGRDHLRSFGGTASHALTPAIDGLRSRGVVFEHAWSTPLCSSTRAALLTGRHPHRTGIGTLVERFDAVALDADEVAIPAAVAVAPTPYDSLMLGKWHVGNGRAGPTHPLALGFHRAFGTMANLDAAYGLHPDRGTLDYFRYEWNDDGVLAIETGYATERVVDALRTELPRLQEPWFTMVALHGVHKPWHYPPEAWLRSPLELPADPARSLDWMVESVDLAVEQILALVGPDTTVVFLSDNGTQADVLLDPYLDERFGKGSVQEGGVNVPMVVAGPLVRAPGVSRALVEVTDVFDTVLAIAGQTQASVDQTFGRAVVRDSVSLLPYLGDPSLPSLRATAYTERFEPNGVGVERRLLYQAARDARFKLVRYAVEGEDRLENLYALGDDPVEGPDLLEAPELAADAAAALVRLTAAIDAEHTP